MRPMFSVVMITASAACLAPSAAFAGDPEADRLIYDAFQKHLARLTPDRRPAECENFLRRYPENLYAGEVEKLYRQFTGRDFATTEASEEAGAGLSPAPAAGGDPAAEAAGAISGTEDEAAAALAGDAPIPSDAPIPDGLPVGDYSKPVLVLRPAQRYALGLDFSASPLVGPGLNLAYTPRNNHWLLSAALRAPVFQTVGVALEGRYLFSPQKTFSGYLGLTVEAIQGSMDSILSLVDRDFSGRVEDNGFTWGGLAGVQKVTSEKTAWYLEASYQILNFSTNTNNLSTAVFPGVNFGYLYTFR